MKGWNDGKIPNCIQKSNPLTLAPKDSMLITRTNDQPINVFNEYFLYSLKLNR